MNVKKKKKKNPQFCTSHDNCYYLVWLMLKTIYASKFPLQNEYKNNWMFCNGSVTLWTCGSDNTVVSSSCVKKKD